VQAASNLSAKVMTNGRPKRLYERRWLWIIVLTLGGLGGICAESFWRISVKRVDPVASQWIRASPLVRNMAGSIKSLEIARSWTTTDLGFDGNWSGRLHYIVHGSKDDLDLLILWHQKATDTTPAIDKVQWIDTHGFDTIWPQEDLKNGRG
jgi:hypothetical protein